jgi:heptosyltransferase-2
MNAPPRFLVINTAFIGDIVLALPLVQALRADKPDAHIAMLVIPAAASVLRNHPALDEIIVYDKKGGDRGLRAGFSLARRLKARRFDVALVPHRSLRSALLAWYARIPRRIGFATSVGRALLTDRVGYDATAHEIARNLSLLSPLGIRPPVTELPAVYPGPDDGSAVDSLLARAEAHQRDAGRQNLVALAPGSVWNTKRWPQEHFAALGTKLLRDGYDIALVGGPADVEVCRTIASLLDTRRVVNAAGRLTILQSAELIRRCLVLVSNDSAPQHLAVAVRTPVVTLFGATVPAFGFAPAGPHDRALGVPGLSCRPCSIHGGVRCPIATFVCMESLSPDFVHDTVLEVLHGTARYREQGRA